MEPAGRITRTTCMSPRSPLHWPLPACFLLVLIVLGACGRPMVGETERSACRIQLRDSTNNKDSLLQLREIGDEHYIGTAGLDTTVPLSVEVRVLAGDRLDVDRELISITFTQLKQQYVMPISDTQRTFVTVEGHACTVDERSLLYYLVLKWFPQT
jgi:hypothetical protein